MKSDITTVIYLKGSIDPVDTETWQAFYHEAMSILQIVGKWPTHCGIGESFDELSLFALPPDYSSGLDSEVDITRVIDKFDSKLYLALRNDLAEYLDLHQTADRLKQFIHFQAGQICEVADQELFQYLFTKGGGTTWAEKPKTVRIIEDWQPSEPIIRPVFTASAQRRPEQMTFDETKRDELYQKVAAGLAAEDADFGVLVPLEDFFEGNNVDGSIGCNLFRHPGILKFYNVLTSIRDRKSVNDVRVEIAEFEDGTWAYSERVWIVAKRMPVARLEDWVEVLSPSEVDVCSEGEHPFDASDIPRGHAVYSLWWD